MKTKAITIQAMDDSGKGLALLATLSAVDHDGDTYKAGAFSWKEGGHQWVSMIPAHDRRKMPFGKARVYEDGDQALADLHLNLDTAAGRDWHAALKFDLMTGTAVQQWSFGYEAIDFDYHIRGTERVRMLKKLDLDEISPVLRGAGLGTRTLAIKSAELRDDRFAALMAELGEMADTVEADPTVASATGIKQLRAIHDAMGRMLACCADDGEIAAEVKARLASDTALAGYLMHQSRRHLPAG